MKNTFIALFVILALSLGAAHAASALDATEAARAQVPESFTYLYTEKDNGKFEVHFLNEETLEEYEIAVDAESGALLTKESKREGVKGGANITFTDESAFEIVKFEYPDAVLTGIARLLDDGMYEIRVYFTAEGIYGTYELNAETGEVLERNLIFGQAIENWTVYFDADDDDALISNWQDVPVQEQKAPAETETKKATEKKSDKKSDSSGDYISVSKAKSVITGRYPGAKITEIEFDRDDGKYVYEGEAIYNGKEYDFKVNAVTGKLIKWERD